MSDSSFIQYGKQTIEEEDINAIVKVFRENQYLTTGPRVKQFEQDVCNLTGATYAISCSNGTAALHCAMFAIGVGKGDEVIVPAITFSATANCVVYEGGTPVFCDVEPDTLNMDVDCLESLITDRTCAVIMVDMCGAVPNYTEIRRICDQYGLVLIEDSAHSIGLKLDNGLYVGNIADLTTFSFHPVKNMTTGEGGMITTNNKEYAKRMFSFRSHGISVDYKDRKLYEYDIVRIGYNYRLTDFQCALGISQLRRVEKWIARRQEIARIYDQAFEPCENLFTHLSNKYGCAYHLYIIKLRLENLDCDRDVIFKELKELNIGCNVHYRPVYLLTAYQNMENIMSSPGLCPNAEKSYERMITLPLFPTMTDEQIDRVIQTVIHVVSKHQIN